MVKKQLEQMSSRAPVYKAAKVKSEEVDADIVAASVPTKQVKEPHADKQADSGRVKGLSNLGNTCFFNAVMQNLCQTHLLKEELNVCLDEDQEIHLKDDDAVIDNQTNDSLHLEPLDLPLAEGGGLTNALLRFVEEMASSSKPTINPSQVFGQVCQKSPRFRGFQQQDSHELLRCVTDGVKTEEIKRAKTAILKHFDLGPGSSGENAVSEHDKSVIKGYGNQVKHTLIDRVFGGYFINCVTCLTCQTPYPSIEPFLDISLPIIDEKRKTVKQNRIEDADKEIKSEAMDCDDNEENDKSDGAEMDAEEAADRETTSDTQTEVEEKDVTEILEKHSAGTPGSDAAVICSESNKQTVNDDFQCSSENITTVEMPTTDSSEAKDSDVSETTNQSITSCEVVKLGAVNTCGSPADSHELEPDTCCSESPATESAKPENNVEELTSALASVQLQDTLAASPSSSGPHHTDSQCTDRLSGSSHDVVHEAMIPLQVDRETSNENNVCSLPSCLSHFTTKELLEGANKFLCVRCTKQKSTYDKNGKPQLFYSDAIKQMLILVPPAVLTIQLKRFHQVGFNLQKSTRTVTFPLLLDLTPYCSSLCQSSPQHTNCRNDCRQIVYSLYGIVEHSGSLRSGHYTACVKVRSSVPNAREFLQRLRLADVTPDNAGRLLARFARSVQCQNAEHYLEPENIAAPQGSWYYVSDSHVSEIKAESDVLRRQAYLLFYERIC